MDGSGEAIGVGAMAEAATGTGSVDATWQTRWQQGTISSATM